MGVLYALAGAVGVAAAVVTFAIGVMILRVDALAKLVRQSGAPAILDVAPERGARESEPAPAEETVLAPVVGRSGDAGERQ